MERPVELSRIRRVLLQHEHVCGNCAEEFEPHEHVVLVQVVLPYRVWDANNQKWFLSFEKILEEDGDFTHAPYFFHVKCWEEAYASLKDLMEEVGPYNYEPGSCNVVTSCSICASDVAEGEELGIVHLGQFRLSPHQPNLCDAIDVAFHNNPNYLCTACLNELNCSVLELWNEDDGIRDNAIERERRKHTWVSAGTT